MKNIYPIFDEILNRDDKEKLHKQHSIVLWFTGLSGSGKSTTAKGLEKKLYDEGFSTVLLDGDNIRHGINNNLSFSEADRAENIRRVAEVANLFLHNGLITICSFISPTHAMRNHAKQIIGEDNFFEVFVDASIELCQKRDPKGLYKKVKRGEIKNFTGIDSEYEKPFNPFLKLKTEELTIDKAINLLYDSIIDKIKK
ncbi:MAG: adenylyl-sulfate kinase [Bacteroidota bacterium]|nr:adenylyl-sulfate kinase [Bacteroidota bacterium]